MTVQIAHDGGYRCYRLEGRTRRYVGPVWPTPKEASRYAYALEASEGISPLRASIEPSDPRPVTPLRGGQVDGSIDVPRGS